MKGRQGNHAISTHVYENYQDSVCTFSNEMVVSKNGSMKVIAFTNVK